MGLAGEIARGFDRVVALRGNAAGETHLAHTNRMTKGRRWARPVWVPGGRAGEGLTVLAAHGDGLDFKKRPRRHHRLYGRDGERWAGPCQGAKRFCDLGCNGFKRCSGFVYIKGPHLHEIRR